MTIGKKLWPSPEVKNKPFDSPGNLLYWMQYFTRFFAQDYTNKKVITIAIDNNGNGNSNNTTSTNNKNNNINMISNNTGRPLPPL